jgi:fumarate reductase flavoprotein subunit
MAISRRDLLFGAGCSLAGGFHIGSLGASGLQARIFDAAIVGGGTAGLPTAIFAALSGADVLVIEKTSNLGGTLLLSTGQIAGSETVFQQRAGIADSPDAHYADVMRINQNTSDPSLTRLTVDNAGATINWLADHGFEILPGHPVTGIGHDHFRVARYLQGVHNGISILQAFLPTFRALVSKGKITVLTESEVVELIQEKSGKVLGVLVKDSSDNI